MSLVTQKPQDRKSNRGSHTLPLGSSLLLVADGSSGETRLPCPSWTVSLSLQPGHWGNQASDPSVGPWSQEAFTRGDYSERMQAWWLQRDQPKEWPPGGLGGETVEPSLLLKAQVWLWVMKCPQACHLQTCTHTCTNHPTDVHACVYVCICGTMSGMNVKEQQDLERRKNRLGLEQ